LVRVKVLFRVKTRDMSSARARFRVKVSIRGMLKFIIRFRSSDMAIVRV
jgi:hypothetical protein